MNKYTQDDLKESGITVASALLHLDQREALFVLDYTERFFDDDPQPPQRRKPVLRLVITGGKP